MRPATSMVASSRRPATTASVFTAKKSDAYRGRCRRYTRRRCAEKVTRSASLTSHSNRVFIIHQLCSMVAGSGPTQKTIAQQPRIKAKKTWFSRILLDLVVRPLWSARGVRLSPWFWFISSEHLCT